MDLDGPARFQTATAGGASLGDFQVLREERWFVGREHELAVFEEWLATAGPAPTVLLVTGHGGIGKSTLLRAFARRARALGDRVVLLDCRDFPHTPEGLAAALAPEAVDIVAALNETLPLILLDSCEELGPLERYLNEQLLPRLDARVHVVLADRQPVPASWRQNAPSSYLVRTLQVHNFTNLESREYLGRRGVDDPVLVEEAQQVGGGNPLALALAADAIVEFGVRHLEAAPEWRLAVRSLVERLLREAKTRDLRALLEASVVLRQFDEAALAALLERSELEDSFADLCRLSAVQPTEHGLRLHDDVRRALVDDLRWRAPERYRALRLRALAYLRERARAAPPEERAWLVAERLFLSENVFLQAMLFSEDEGGDLWVAPARAEDRGELPRLWHDFLLLPGGELRLQGEGDPLLAFFIEAAAPILDHPATRMQLVRDRRGRVLAGSVVVPVCGQTLDMMRAHPAFGPVLEAWQSATGSPPLPASPRETDTYYLITIAHGAERAEAARAALMRDMFGLFAQSGIYLVSSFFPSISAFFEACGFTDFAAETNSQVPKELPMRNHVLDLTAIGVDAWLERLLGSRQPPRAPDLGRQPAAHPNGLTAREVDVLRLLAGGRSNREIAETLVLSERTVERHVANIYRKIDAGGRSARAAAAAFALGQGLGPVAR